MRPTIQIGDTATAPDAAVVVQMGRGDRRGTSQLLVNVRRGHDFWRGVIDGCGRFAISAYVLDGLDEAELLSAIPNDTFGRSTTGRLRAEGFELVPTTITVPPSFPAYSFQQWHYSIVLPVPGLSESIADTEEAWNSASEAVAAELGRLVRLFEPRLVNPYRS